MGIASRVERTVVHKGRTAHQNPIYWLSKCRLAGDFGAKGGSRCPRVDWNLRGELSICHLNYGWANVKWVDVTKLTNIETDRPRSGDAYWMQCMLIPLSPKSWLAWWRGMIDEQLVGYLYTWMFVVQFHRDASLRTRRCIRLWPLHVQSKVWQNIRKSQLRVWRHDEGGVSGRVASPSRRGARGWMGMGGLGRLQNLPYPQHPLDSGQTCRCAP